MACIDDYFQKKKQRFKTAYDPIKSEGTKQKNDPKINSSSVFEKHRKEKKKEKSYHELTCIVAARDVLINQLVTLNEGLRTQSHLYQQQLLFEQGRRAVERAEIESLTVESNAYRSILKHLVSNFEQEFVEVGQKLHITLQEIEKLKADCTASKVALPIPDALQDELLHCLHFMSQEKIKVSQKAHEALPLHVSAFKKVVDSWNETRRKRINILHTDQYLCEQLSNLRDDVLQSHHALSYNQSIAKEIQLHVARALLHRAQQYVLDNRLERFRHHIFKSQPPPPESGLLHDLTLDDLLGLKISQTDVVSGASVESESSYARSHANSRCAEDDMKLKRVRVAHLAESNFGPHSRPFLTYFTVAEFLIDIRAFTCLTAEKEWIEFLLLVDRELFSLVSPLGYCDRHYGNQFTSYGIESYELCRCVAFRRNEMSSVLEDLSSL